MDTTSRLYMGVEGDQPFPGQVFKSEKPSLAIRCERGRAELILAANTQIHGPRDGFNDHNFRVRFDNGKPEALVGSRSTNGQAVFFPSPQRFIKRLLSTNTVLVEVTPFQHGPATSNFDVRGLDKHREALKNDCKIK